MRKKVHFTKSPTPEPTRLKEFDLSVFKYRLVELMKEKGYNTLQLAKASGISLRCIQKYRDNSDNSAPTAKNLFALAETLNVSADYLIGRDNVRHFGNDEIIEATGLSETAIEVLRGFVSGGYSKVNNQMINYILEKYHESGADNQLTVLWSMYSYIHAADLVYHGNTRTDDEIIYKMRPDPDDNVTFFDRGRNAIYRLNEPEKLYQVSAMEEIQQYLRIQADEYRQQTETAKNAVADHLRDTFKSISERSEAPDSFNLTEKKVATFKKSRKGSEEGQAPDDKQSIKTKGGKRK